jgi:Zn-dependent protease with chaperone function
MPGTKKENVMKRLTVSVQTFFVLTILGLVLSACAGGPDASFNELENKGSAMGIPVPDWVKTYASKGVSALQEPPQFKDAYCVVGEETGVNKQFVLAWADNFSARQRIGAMLRTNIAGKYTATVQANAASLGALGQEIASGVYRQNIDNSVKPELFNGYHAALLDSYEINAFATPGGQIFITRGLVQSASPEDALAAVAAEPEKTQKSWPGGFYNGFSRTHPTPAQRLSAVQTAVGLYRTADTRPSRQSRFDAVKQEKI